MIVAALIAVPTVGAGATAGAGEWSGVDRVVAVGDLHGSADKLITLLDASGLIDGGGHWIGGDDHLVIAGDFLDRGRDERRLLDLLRRLEQESEEAGGRVHVLLGNHEVMNLFRDTRYVNPAAIRDYAEEESEEERVAALRSFNPGGIATRRAGDLTQFNRRYPPGFFARQRHFDPGGETGQWLLERPAIVKINDVVYLHGGLSERFADLGVEEINRRVTEQLWRHVEARQRLQELGVITPAMRLKEVQVAAEKALGAHTGRRAPEIRQAAAQLIAATDSAVLGSLGPLWYRGNSFEDERIEAGAIEKVLEHLGARALVVAHSPTGGQITSRFHGQLYRLDHDIRRSQNPSALIAERGEMLVLDSSTGEVSPPRRELPSGSVSWPQEAISDLELEQFLSRASVVEDSPFAKPIGSHGRIVVLERDGQRRRAIFKSVERSSVDSPTPPERYQHEVAAYRLDRMLGLDLVPVTVTREIDGREGSLQAFVESAVDQGTASAYGLSHFSNVTTDEELARGGVFDALIDNRERTPSDVIFLLQGGEVFLVDHARGFSLSPEPGGPVDRPLALDPALAASLFGLDRAALERELGGLLGQQQIEALLERRDWLLERAAPGVGEPTAVAGSHGRPR